MAETYWKAQENRIRRLLENNGWDARRQPGSGNLPIAALKGDVIATYGDTKIMVDHKSTRGRENITLARGDLRKLNMDALVVEALPVLTFGFKGSQTLYGVMPLSQMLFVLESREQWSP